LQVLLQTRGTLIELAFLWLRVAVADEAAEFDPPAQTSLENEGTGPQGFLRGLGALHGWWRGDSGLFFGLALAGSRREGSGFLLGPAFLQGGSGRVLTGRRSWGILRRGREIVSSDREEETLGLAVVAARGAGDGEKTGHAGASFGHSILLLLESGKFGGGAGEGIPSSGDFFFGEDCFGGDFALDLVETLQAFGELLAGEIGRHWYGRSAGVGERRRERERETTWKREVRGKCL
jgi:hypothetical protein